MAQYLRAIGAVSRSWKKIRMYAQLKQFRMATQTLYGGAVVSHEPRGFYLPTEQLIGGVIYDEIWSPVEVESNGCVHLWRMSCRDWLRSIYLVI